MIETFEPYHPNKSRKNHSYQIKELPKYLTQEEVKRNLFSKGFNL